VQGCTDSWINGLRSQGSPIRTMRIGPPRPVPSLFGYFLGNAKK
jgi:hypothetical protein